MTGYEDLDEYGDWSYVAGYGTCWRPEFWWQDGLRITLAIGFGWGRGVGHGWKMNRGDSLHSTMVGGPSQAVDGCGFRDRAWCGRYMRQRWWPGWVADQDLISRSGLEQAWDGSRWLREKYLFRATA